MADADIIRARLELHAEMAQALIDPQLEATMAAVAAVICDSYRRGGKVLLFGNGGSAADAEHIAGELTGRYLMDRAPLPAIALADSAAGFSAIGNDYGFGEVFARQVRAFGRPGDVAVGLSTSGGSANVLAGLRAARDLELVTVGVTGRSGHRLAELSDHCVHVPADQTPQIQEGTMLVLHTVCELVEHELFGVRPTAFLDRDGTINVKAPEGDYVKSWDEFAFLPGAERAVQLLADAGWRVVVVTNQRGVALGRMTIADVDDIHRRMREAVPVDAVYVCPHERDVCDCRKPGTGLFRQAMRDDPAIDPASSVVIGDAESDMLAGEAFGARTILVGSLPLPSLLDAATRLVSSAG